MSFLRRIEHPDVSTSVNFEWRKLGIVIDLEIARVSRRSRTNLFLQNSEILKNILLIQFSSSFLLSQWRTKIFEQLSYVIMIVLTSDNYKYNTRIIYS